MAFKFSKGQGSSSRRFTSRLPGMISDDPAVQRELAAFMDSVAMKGDLGYLNLADAPSEYGDGGDYVGMNDDEDGLTFITPPAASSGFGDFVGVVTTAQEFDFASAPAVWQQVTSHTANYDPLNFISGSSITVPADCAGIYQVLIHYRATVLKSVPASNVNYPKLSITHLAPSMATSPASRFLVGVQAAGWSPRLEKRLLCDTSDLETSISEQGIWTYFTELAVADTVTWSTNLHYGTITTVTTSKLGFYITLVKVADARA